MEPEKLIGKIKHSEESILFRVLTVDHIEPDGLRRARRDDCDGDDAGSFKNR